MPRNKAGKKQKQTRPISAREHAPKLDRTKKLPSLSAQTKKPKPPTILLTGFAPALSSPVNASWRVVAIFDGATIAGHRIITAQLPISFHTSHRILRNLIHRLKPKLVIAVGESGRRSAISIERVAINCQDASRPDNEGHQPIDRKILKTGPAAYFSTLPIRTMVNAVKQTPIPVEISQTAGTFVCNHVFYRLMHDLKASKSPMKAGFIHVPFLKGQDPQRAGMEEDQIAEGLGIAIAAAAKSIERQK